MKGVFKYFWKFVRPKKIYSTTNDLAWKPVIWAGFPEQLFPKFELSKPPERETEPLTSPQTYSVRISEEGLRHLFFNISSPLHVCMTTRLVFVLAPIESGQSSFVLVNFLSHVQNFPSPQSLTLSLVVTAFLEETRPAVSQNTWRRLDKCIRAPRARSFFPKNSFGIQWTIHKWELGTGDTGE